MTPYINSLTNIKVEKFYCKIRVVTINITVTRADTKTSGQLQQVYLSRIFEFF